MEEIDGKKKTVYDTFQQLRVNVRVVFVSI